MQLQADAQGIPVNATMVPQGDDARLLVKFYKSAEQNNFESSKQGRPIFDEVDFISIITPGDRNSRVERPARDEDKERFPNAWASFQNKGPVQLAGTPVDQWPRLAVSQVAEAKAANIFTVEAISNLSDAVTSQMGLGWTQLREEARAYVKTAAEQGHAQHLAAELAKRDETIEAQNTTIKDLGDRLLALESKKEKKAA